MDQLNLFPDVKEIEKDIPPKGKGHEVKVTQPTGPRPGVCECGAKGWPLKVIEHQIVRMCRCGRRKKLG